MTTAHSNTLRELGAATARVTATPDLPPLPARPSLTDLLRLRLNVPKFGLPFAPGPHCVQSATHALRAGLDEEAVMGCLLHDLGLGLARPDHGWWGAQLIEPYVSEKVSWAVRHHQALRFYPDPEAGYEYPELYRTLFGPDYQPPAHVQEAYKHARRHRWYMAARSITLFDDYSFDRELTLDVEPLIDIIGRHFRQPTEGLGNDRTPAAHMWRTIAYPNRPL